MQLLAGSEAHLIELQEVRLEDGGPVLPWPFRFVADPELKDYAPQGSARRAPPSTIVQLYIPPYGGFADRLFTLSSVLLLSSVLGKLYFRACRQAVGPLASILAQTLYGPSARRLAVRGDFRASDRVRRRVVVADLFTHGPIEGLGRYTCHGPQ